VAAAPAAGSAAATPLQAAPGGSTLFHTLRKLAAAAARANSAANGNIGGIGGEMLVDLRLTLG
jgi:hypothetical protein